MHETKAILSPSALTIAALGIESLVAVVVN